MSELSFVATQLEMATTPEDAFGERQAELRGAFAKLLRMVHPDHNHTEQVLAHAVTERLLRLKAVADERVAAGTYGRRLPLPEYEVFEICADKGDVRWPVLRKPIVGDVADIYLQPTNAYGKLGAAIKVARSKDDNDLMRAERSAIKLLNKEVFTMVKEGFPKLLDGFQVDSREANVMERLPVGFITGQEVNRRLPKGVDARSLVWTFKRVLSMLDWTHHLGLVHGAVLPQHVLFYPDNDGTTTNPHPYKHTARLVGWGNSVEYKQRTRLSTWCPSWKDHYPRELILKASVGPSSDIYMAARLIKYLAVTTKLPNPLASVLVRCLHDDTAKRYQSCGEVFAAWVRAAEEVYGAPKWIDFNVPK